MIYTKYIKNGLGVALWWLCGSFGVALGSQSVGYQ
jgi:hypothetical protein